MATLDKELVRPIHLDDDEEDIFAPAPLGDDEEEIDGEIKKKKAIDPDEIDEETFEDEEGAGVDLDTDADEEF